MKKYYINNTVFRFYIAIIIFTFLACEKYKPVIEYAAKEEITVNGLQSDYSVISGIDVLDIDPIVESNKEGELEYLWGIYEQNTQGYTPVLDTIAKTKKLNYLVNLTAKDWYLVLRVRNKKTDYSAYFNAKVQVETSFTRGWYVPKDDGSATDMDFFVTSTDIRPSGKKIENVYSVMNGEKLAGKAKMLTFFADYKAPFNNTYVNTRSLSLMSDKDIAIVEVSTMKKFRGSDNILQGAPTSRNFGMICNDFLKYFLINDGQLHSMVGQGLSTGVFGGRKLLGSQDKPYFLSQFHLVPSVGSAYFFDEISTSFFAATDRSLYLNPVNTMMMPPTIIPFTNKKLIFMGTKANAYSGGAPQGFAIFQDKDNPSVKSIHQLSPQGPNGLGVTSVAISPSDKLAQATHYGLLNGDQALIFFSVGNQIWSRNLMSPVAIEKIQYQVPSGEEVTFIRHRKINATGVEAPFNYNYVMIGTKVGDSYRVRMFTKSTLGDLDPEPYFILEGKGRAVDAVFVGPSVTHNAIYPNTY